MVKDFFHQQYYIIGFKDFCIISAQWWIIFTRKIRLQGKDHKYPIEKGRKAGKIIIFKSGLLMGYVTSLEGSHLKSLRTLGESLRTDAAPELPELRAGLRDWALASMPENNQTFLSPKAS